MKNKFFSISTRYGTLISILGKHLAFNVWGNCLAPALCFKSERMNVRGAANPINCFSLTYRSKNHTETSFYFRTDFNFHWSINWNSAHLARQFGRFFETDFGGYHQWRGHIDL